MFFLSDTGKYLYELYKILLEGILLLNLKRKKKKSKQTKPFESPNTHSKPNNHL